MKHLNFIILLILSQQLGHYCQNQESSINIILENKQTANYIKNDSYSGILDRPQIGLALSGGGARGLAQIGVLKVFEQNGIRIDAIAGTSIGAIIGGLYAAGYTATEIESLAYQINWNEIIQDKPSRQQLFLGQKEQRSRYIFQIRLKGFSVDFRTAYTAGQKLMTTLSEIILHAPYPVSNDFDDLRVRFRAITTDIISGKKVILQNGSLSEALRASMAIPLLFTPVSVDSMLLVDGGLVQNLPTSEVKSLDTDLVIAIDTSSKLRNAKSLNAPWKIADQVTTIMHRESILQQSEIADLSIQPNLMNISNTDFDQIGTIIQAGEEAAKQVIPEIERLITNRTEDTENKQLFINEIQLSGFYNLKHTLFQPILPVKKNHQIPLDQIIWAGQSILQTGYFQKVTINIDTINHQLDYRVVENPIINKIEIWGNTVFPDSQLVKEFIMRPKEVLNQQTLQSDLSTLLEKYHQFGYSLARIIDVNPHDQILKITIDEGILSQIHLHGNRRTQPFVILREMALKPGDLFNFSLLKNGIENIYSTGYFESVQFKIQNYNQSHQLSIHLVERGYRLIRFGTRYDLERKNKTFLELVEENICGLGANGSIMGLLGNRDGLIRGSIRSDRLFHTYLTTNLNISFSNRDYDFYDKNDYKGNYKRSDLSGRISLGQQMRRLGTLSITLQLEHINLKTQSGTTPQETYRLNSLNIRSEIDTRNRLPFPKSGKYHLFQYEAATQFLGSQISYIKLLSIMKSYYALSNRLTFCNQIQWGTADLTTPFPKQFYLGGLDSFFGLPEHGYMGRRFFIFSGELIYQFPWFRWLENYFSIRYDFGGIWMDYKKLSAQDFKHGIGFIFSINTPLGPIKLGYGRMSEGVYKGYFSAGYYFD